jgi:hypothetical protein
VIEPIPDQSPLPYRTVLLLGLMFSRSASRGQRDDDSFAFAGFAHHGRQQNGNDYCRMMMYL